MAKQTALGHWWIPGDDTTKTPGLLEWDTDVDSPGNLELVHAFPSDGFEMGGYVPLIVGEAEAMQYNLLGCTNVGSRRPFQSITSANQHWMVSNVGAGPHMDIANEPLSGCFVSLDGLGGWIMGKELEAIQSAASETSSDNSISDRGTPISTFKLADALVQLVAHGGQRRTIGVLDDSECNLEITTLHHRSFDQWKSEVLLPLQALVSISTGFRGSVKTALFTRPGKDGLMFVRGQWTGQWTYVSPWLVKPLVTARQLEKTVGPSLDGWGGLYAAHTYAFRAIQGMPLVPTAPQEAVAFMTMVSGLDTLLDRETDKRFSRGVLASMRQAVCKLLPDEVRAEVLEDLGQLRSDRLKSKLMKFITGKSQLFGELAANASYTEWTVRKILATRNCAAHSAPDTCAEAASGVALYALQEFVRMLVNARVLELLGFSEAQLVQQFKDTVGFGTDIHLHTVWKPHS